MKKGFKKLENKKIENYEECCTPRKFDLMFWILLIGLISLPLAATFLHIKIHPSYSWLTYLTLFDVVIISLLYLSRKTIFYGFMLNTVFFITGVIAHFYVLGLKGINDILMSIPDFSLGYAMWEMYR